MGRPKGPTKFCSNCGDAIGPGGARGYCGKCYQRWWKHGDSSVVLDGRRRSGTCSAPEGCTRTDIVGADDLCHKHYQRKRVHGSPSILLPHYTSSAVCSECDRPARALGYCGKHYRRFHKYGDPSIVNKTGNQGGQRKYLVNHGYFDEINTPAKAYWLGFIAADGCVTMNGTVLQFEMGLATYDAGHLLKFARDVGSTAPVVQARPDLVRIRIGSFRFAESLVRLGVTERKSLVVEPPLERLRGLERYYWRGLWDGDGTISRDTSRRVRWTVAVVGSFACVDAFGAWGRQISYSTARATNKTSKNPDLWRWGVHGTGKAQLLAEELRAAGEALGLDRKQALLEEFCAIDLDEHVAALNASRAVKMREAWATGRH